MREPGESLAEAAMRETREETGLVVRVGGVVAVSEVLSRTHDVFVTFAATILGGSLATPLDDKVVEVVWMPAAQSGMLMPWHPDGLAAMSVSHGATYVCRVDADPA